MLGRAVCFFLCEAGSTKLHATSLVLGLLSDLAHQSESRLRPSLFIITGKVLPDLNRYPQRKRRSVHQSIVSSLFNVEWPNDRPFFMFEARTVSNYICTIVTDTGKPVYLPGCLSSCLVYIALSPLGAHIAFTVF